MRLQRAMPVDEIEGFAGDDFSGFEGPEERAERRARRKERRSGRRERRATRKLSRVSRRKAKLREKAGLPRKAQRGAGRKAAGGAAAATAMRSPASQPMDPSWDEQSLEPAPMDWSDQGDPQVLDAEWSEVDQGEGWDDELDEEMEGVGAFRPLRALGKGVKNTAQRVQSRVQARRAARRGVVPGGGGGGGAGARNGWGPNVRMGRHLRIQAATGHRAAVINLKPGLYLVAEIPEAVTRTEFGFAPLLAPLMMKAAKSAIDEPPEAQPQRRGPLRALFRRRHEGGRPVRLFRAREAQAHRQGQVGPAPKALPGPVAAAPALQPGAGSGAGRTFLLPAPNVGWADEHDVAEMLGCEAFEESWR